MSEGAPAADTVLEVAQQADPTPPVRLLAGEPRRRSGGRRKCWCPHCAGERLKLKGSGP